MGKYSIGFKKEVVSFYKDNGQNETLRVYNISNTALHKWVRQSKSGDYMRKSNKKYSMQDKLEIIAYLKQNGAIDTEKRFNISHSVFNKWERMSTKLKGMTPIEFRHHSLSFN